MAHPLPSCSQASAREVTVLSCSAIRHIQASAQHLRAMPTSVYLSGCAVRPHFPRKACSQSCAVMQIHLQQRRLGQLLGLVASSEWREAPLWTTTCNEFLLFGWNRFRLSSFPQCRALQSMCLMLSNRPVHTARQPACQCVAPKIVTDMHSPFAR